MAISLGYYCGAMSSLCSVYGPRARFVWRLALVLALSALAAVALSGRLGSMQGGVLIMLPALLLAVVMLTHPYLGERIIRRLRVRRARRPRLGAHRVRLPHLPVRAVRGGRLIAMALAGRAPPLTLVGRFG
jgi:hypothetical protein